MIRILNQSGINNTGHTVIIRYEKWQVINIIKNTAP